MKKKSKHRNFASSKSTELIFKDSEDERYAFALRSLGDRRFEVIDDSGTVSTGKLKGSIRRNNRLLIGGLCLVQLRDGDGEKCDIIYIYNENETKQLRKYGELDDLDKEKSRHEDQKFDFREVEDDDIAFESGSEVSIDGI